MSGVSILFQNASYFDQVQIIYLLYLFLYLLMCLFLYLDVILLINDPKIPTFGWPASAGCSWPTQIIHLINFYHFNIPVNPRHEEQKEERNVS